MRIKTRALFSFYWCSLLSAPRLWAFGNQGTEQWTFCRLLIFWSPSARPRSGWKGFRSLPFPKLHKQSYSAKLLFLTPPSGETLWPSLGICLTASTQIWSWRLEELHKATWMEWVVSLSRQKAKVQKEKLKLAIKSKERKSESKLNLSPTRVVN